MEFKKSRIRIRLFSKIMTCKIDQLQKLNHQNRPHSLTERGLFL